MTWPSPRSRAQASSAISVVAKLMRCCTIMLPFICSAKLRLYDRFVLDRGNQPVSAAQKLSGSQTRTRAVTVASPIIVCTDTLGVFCRAACST